MNRSIARIAALAAIVVVGFAGYMYFTQADPITTEATNLETVVQNVADTAAVDPAPGQDILVIEVAGSTSGIIEIRLNSELAPGHTAQIKALAAAGAYDDVVFHRVIDGFMAQTGDVQYGKRTGSVARAGTGSSDFDNLKAEFSDKEFLRGVVGMARANSPDSGNSQFFIMFSPAPFLNGKYTVVGEVIAGQDVVDAIKKGNPDQNGSVQNPDYMKTVRIKSGE
ncbi:MAG: peptidylprolyl isomerase [Paracoccaceae bacterium]|jgi:peptidylprolyl isomerase